MPSCITSVVVASYLARCVTVIAVVLTARTTASLEIKDYSVSSEAHAFSIFSGVIRQTFMPLMS